MDSLIGVPSEAILGALVALAALVRRQDLENVKEKLNFSKEEMKVLRKMIERNSIIAQNSTQKLSKEQLEEVVKVIKESIKSQNAHNQNNQTMIFNHFNEQLSEILEKVNKK